MDAQGLLKPQAFRYDVLVVGDEVITGFGRTGKMWGCTAFQQSVDLLSCAKQLTSGYVPLSVTRTGLRRAALGQAAALFRE